MKKLVLAVAVLLSLNSCSNNYETGTKQVASPDPRWKISKIQFGKEYNQYVMVAEKIGGGNQVSTTYPQQSGTTTINRSVVTSDIDILDDPYIQVIKKSQVLYENDSIFVIKN